MARRRAEFAAQRPQEAFVAPRGRLGSHGQSYTRKNRCDIFSRMSHSILHLKCINCGAGLEISPDMNQFACGYCGVGQLVERKGGTVALKHVTDAISKVQVGTDKTAAELAIRRLQDESVQLGAAYRQRMQIGVGQKSGMPLVVIGIGAVTILAAVIAAAIVEAMVKGMGRIAAMGVLGLGGVAAYMAKREHNKGIDEEINRDLSAIREEGNKIPKKIAKNKAIVDS